jgi:hypothetical protein
MSKGIEIIQHQITFDEFMRDEIWKAWSFEPVTKQLKVPGEAIGLAFPVPNEEMCVSAVHNSKFIGQSNANNYARYRMEAPGKFEKLAEYPHDGTKRWADMLRKNITKLYFF